MKSIGVSMIVKNESECIEACLESIKGADEIVIVDTGSEDNTVEICKRYTSNVFTDYKWDDNFAEARNVSLSRCTADWILIIDADEVLKDGIVPIKNLLNSGFMSKYMGMIFRVQTGMELIQSCRVIKNDPSIEWVGAVHNTLQFKGDKGSDTLKAKCYQTHFEITSGYSPAHHKDPDRSLRILTKQLDIDPLNTRYMYYISREYISRRMNPENKDRIPEFLGLIIYWLEKNDSIAFFEDWTNEYADALYCLSLAYLEKGTISGDSTYWYKAIMASLKSFMILPSYKAPAEVLSAAMMTMPRGNKYPAASQFWADVAKRCTNQGVAQIREKK
jgi:glycosyltransferase involved in cell wall biosynthesis